MACAARIDDRIEARTEGGMPGEVRPWTLVDTNCDEGSRWLALAKALLGSVAEATSDTIHGCALGWPQRTGTRAPCSAGSVLVGIAKG